MRKSTLDMKHFMLSAPLGTLAVRRGTLSPAHFTLAARLRTLAA